MRAVQQVRATPSLWGVGRALQQWDTLAMRCGGGHPAFVPGSLVLQRGRLAVPFRATWVAGLPTMERTLAPHHLLPSSLVETQMETFTRAVGWEGTVATARGTGAVGGGHSWRGASRGHPRLVCKGPSMPPKRTPFLNPCGRSKKCRTARTCPLSHRNRNDRRVTEVCRSVIRERGCFAPRPSFGLTWRRHVLEQSVDEVSVSPLFNVLGNVCAARIRAPSDAGDVLCVVGEHMRATRARSWVHWDPAHSIRCQPLAAPGAAVAVGPTGRTSRRPRQERILPHVFQLRCHG